MSREIPLTRGKVAIVDDEDYEAMSAHRWYVIHPSPTRWYAARSVGKKMVCMHRLLCSTVDSVDHINGDGLDNRRANLRPCTQAQNNVNCGPKRNNTSGFKGVSRCAQTGRWSAFIGMNGHRRRIGRFDTPEAAHAAYCAEAKVLHGEFARFA